MRSVLFSIITLTLVLAACGGGQPRLYKVAINQTALDGLPVACFNGNTAPKDTFATTNGFINRDWLIWDGVDKQYLDVGTNTWVMGNAGAIQTGSAASTSLPTLIEGGPKVFSVQKVITHTNPTPAEVDTRALTVTFEPDAPGATLKGSIALKSTYSCSGCGQPSCEATIQFVGRRIDSQLTSNYPVR